MAATIGVCDELLVSIAAGDKANPFIVWHSFELHHQMVKMSFLNLVELRVGAALLLVYDIHNIKWLVCGAACRVKGG